MVLPCHTCTETENQVQAQPEEPVGNRPSSIGSQCVPIDKVEDTQSTKDAEDGSRGSNCECIWWQEDQGCQPANNPRYQIDEQVAERPIERFYSPANEEQRKHIERDM